MKLKNYYLFLLLIVVGVYACEVKGVQPYYYLPGAMVLAEIVHIIRRRSLGLSWFPNLFSIKKLRNDLLRRFYKEDS